MSLEYRAVHRASDKIEPRMARAIELAAERLRSRLPMHELEDAIERKDLRHVNDIIAQFDFADAYVPSSEILQESVTRGGKIADEEARNG
jgi:hypothetical protein